MRRLLPFAALVSILSLSGCGLVGGLKNDWPAMPVAKQFVPANGLCHARVPADSQLENYVPVPCTEEHLTETFFVGELPAAMTDLRSSPLSDYPQAEPAWQECVSAMANKAGRDWLDRRLEVIAYWPGDAGWRAGARWLRCDLAVPRNMAGSQGGYVTQDKPLSTKTLDGLSLGCFELQETSAGKVDGLVTSPCDVAHNAEYVGSIEMPKDTKRPSTDDEWDDIYSHCFQQIADFIEVRYSALQVGAYAAPVWETWGEGGSSGVRCYLWLDEKKMTGSAKGTRGVGIPK